MRLFALPILMTAFALASCSGATAPVPSGATFGSSNGLAATQEKTGTLVIRIIVPHAAHRDRLRIVRAGHPSYVSASTAAMKIVLESGSKTVTTVVVPLTATSPGCTKSSSGTACSTNVILPECTTPGKCYTAVVSTYDAVFCNGAPPVCKIPATAAELSAGQSVPFRIATGKSNAVSLTLSGVPHSTTITPDALTRANGGAFDLIGPGAHAFTMQTFDADGNAVVGPGSPAYTATTPAGGLTPVIVTVPSSSPNQIWVTPPATLDVANTATFSVTPSFSGQTIDGCKQPGANCDPTSITVDMVQMAAILGSTGVLNLYALDEKNPRRTFTGIESTGYGLEADAAGDIFTPNGRATAYVPPLSAAEPARPACCQGGTTMAVSAGSGATATFLSYFSTAAGPQNVVSSCSPAACGTLAYVLPYLKNQTFVSNVAGDFAYGYPSSSVASPCFAYVYAAPNYGVPVRVTGAPMSATGCAAHIAMDSAGDVFAGDPNDDQIVEYAKASGYHVATRILTGAGTPVFTVLSDSSGDLFDVVSKTVQVTPDSAESYMILQETLASSLSAHQGGSLSPDLTSTVTSGPPIDAASATIGVGAIYVEFHPDGGLIRFALPDLSVTAPPPSDPQSPTGLLVLP